MLRRGLEQVLLLIGVAWLVALMVGAHGRPAYGLEFRGNLWDPGHEILRGESPYDLTYTDRALDTGAECCLQALYPAPTHVLFAPLSWLPFDAGMLLFSTLSIAALFAGLWFFGIRSPAVYGLVLLLPPVFQGIKLGGIIPFLILGCSLCWRWRDRPVLGGIAVAATAVFKVFLWPLWVWLVVTRRYRAALISAVAAVVIVLAGWAVIGFDDLTTYPKLLSNLAAIEQSDPNSYSVASITGRAVPVVLFVLLMLPGSFALAVVAAYVLTPVAWLSTLTILLVPAVLLAGRDERDRLRGYLGLVGIRHAHSQCNDGRDEGCDRGTGFDLASGRPRSTDRDEPPG